MEREDFAKGLSLELLLKIRLNGEKSFLAANYQYISCKPHSKGEEEIAALIRRYYDSRSEESPVQRLTEKCRRLIEGQNDVSFEEYTNLEMMELSKVLNQYLSLIHILMPFKPVFHPGAIVSVFLIFLVSATETIGDTSALASSGLGRDVKAKETAGSIACDGFISSLSAVFGCLPITSFSQNVGLVAMTKVVNRFTPVSYTHLDVYKRQAYRC